MAAHSPPSRTFEAKPAVRSRVPLLLGLMGPSGGGKTFSALRLATGISKVAGGEIYVVDTESKRALHYAEDFKFKHVPFGSPFSPDDYLQVLQFCAKDGATTIVIDSMSHEHEGPGGVLEWQANEVERLTGGDPKKADNMKFLAWSAPKQARRRLLNSILQMDVNIIFCFRAKEKVKLEKGEKPGSMGWMPIAGEEFLFEMTVNFLLPPAAEGVPQWRGLTPDQEMFLKAPPKQFMDMLRTPRSLDESIGEEMAKWAAGAPAVDKEALTVLNKTLIDAGYGTAPVRLEWLSKTLGRQVAGMGSLTPEEIETAMTAAKEA